jgi:KDO2-lipid IV(A) lauroyltransferase
MPQPTPQSLYAPRHWPSWLAIGLLRLAALLPWPLLMALGGGVGRLIKLFSRRRVAIADINLQLCFPQMSAAERQRLISENFSAMGKGLMEVAMGWWWSHDRVERRLLGVEGEENLPADNERGTIFLTAHFSSLELSGRYLGHRCASHAMYRPNENPVIQEMFERHRTRHTLGIIARDDVRSMIRALKAGEGVWFAPDQNYAHKGKVFADFMGVPAATHTATSRFAKTTAARVVPFVLFRERNGYRLRIEPAFENFPSDDVQQDTQRINDLYAEWVRVAPEQYNWIHRRFKTQPDDQPSPYQQADRLHRRKR